MSMTVNRKRQMEKERGNRGIQTKTEGQLSHSEVYTQLRHCRCLASTQQVAMLEDGTE